MNLLNLRDRQIKLCFGTGCYTKGAPKIVAKFENLLRIKLGEVVEEGQISLELTRCIGRCTQGPVAVINGQVYSELTLEKVEEIVAALNLE